jgi:hypothetical protein
LFIKEETEEIVRDLRRAKKKIKKEVQGKQVDVRIIINY